MNYIVLDLEWNQGRSEKESLRHRIPFEIIEIGAVKLNGERQITGKFQRLIKPQIYKELYPITKSIVGINQKELEEGTTFISAIRDFFAWCGADYRFCTWGNMDLMELQKNMLYYGVNDFITKPFPYYDVQKLFALQVEGKKNPRTLEYAVEYFHLEKDESFHRALWDAMYTVKIFQLLDRKLIEAFFSIDYFNNPKDASEEIYVNYGEYSKFISREFPSREDALNDKEVRKVSCFLCGKQTVRKIDWFSSNMKNYYCLAYCREHGYLKGRLQMNKSIDGKRFVIKIVSRLNQEAASRFISHYKEMALKKKSQE